MIVIYAYISAHRMTADSFAIRGMEPRDIKGIVEVHCSLVESWWKDREKGLRSSYEDLTPLERYWHGGSWLTEEFAAPYEKWLNENVGKSYVAEIEADKAKRVVGHCDLVFSEEPEPWGRISQLEIIAVHREYRRRGIGSALVKHTMNVAKEIGYPHYVVGADESEIPFYKRQGLEVFQKMYCYEIMTTDIPKPESKYGYMEELYGIGYPDISRYLLVTRPLGDIAARFIWSKSQTDGLPAFGKPEFLRRVAISLPEGEFGTILTVSNGWAEIWTKPSDQYNLALMSEALRISGAICREHGSDKLKVWLPEELKESARRWKAKQIYASNILHGKL